MIIKTQYYRPWHTLYIIITDRLNLSYMKPHYMLNGIIYTILIQVEVEYEVEYHEYPVIRLLVIYLSYFF